jgi:methanogenic corrinoid protein MtbC1
MPRSATQKKTRLSIGALSSATGVPVETLRTWERRYGVPAATRRASGHRAYELDVVPHLRKVVRALTRGHRPAEILPLTGTELDALIDAVNLPVRPFKDGAASPDSAATPQVRKLLAYTRDFDLAHLRSSLELASVRLSPERYIESVAAPFLRAIGREWSAGRMEVRHEHAASAIVADTLRELRRRFEPDGSAPRVALAMLPGDAHETGLLMAAATFGRAGWNVFYLGPESPVAQIAAFAGDAGIDVVAIGVSATVPGEGVRAALNELRETLPPHVPLIVGGSGAPARLPGITAFRDVHRLEEWIRKHPPARP